LENTLRTLSKSRAPRALQHLRFIRAQRLFRRGHHKKALREIQWVAKRRPDWLKVHVLWASWLLEVGQTARARTILDRLPELHDAGKIHTTEDRLQLARALALLGFAQEAHELLREIVIAEPEHWRAHLYWGHLLREKHNPKEAQKEYQEVLRIWPGRPEAVVGLASILFEFANDVPKAKSLLQKLYLRHGSLRSGRLLEAKMAMYQESFGVAKKTARALVAKNQRDVEAWSTLGAVAFLEDDKKAFKEALRKIKAVHPKNARFWHELGKVSSRFHRYERALAFHKKALAIDPDYAAALVDLGVAYSRLGDDESARIFLNKARDFDPFDKKAFNMTVHLFNGVLKSYERWVKEGIVYRFSKHEATALKEVIPEWISHAREHYRERYGTTLRPPVHIELFEDPKTFSIRSVGTTQFWAHGVCFGHVLTMRSPNAGDFNAREVLLHELSHAYHLQITDGRVPRWFTEGLAELDTMRIDPSLAREIELPMAERFLAKEMIPVCSLNRAFEQASTRQELLHAYMQSRLVLEWLDHERGSEGVQAMLKQFGSGAKIEAALKETYALTCDQAQKSFRAWTKGRLKRVLPPNVFIPTSLPSLKELERRHKKGDARSGALLAWALARQGATERAQELLGDDTVAKDPVGGWVEAWMLFKGLDIDGALQRLDDLERSGTSGAPVALLRAEILEEKGDDEAAIETLESAWNKGYRSEALYSALDRLLEERGLEEQRLENLARWSLVDEHNASLRRSLCEARERMDDPAGLKRALDRWQEIEPLSGMFWLTKAQLEMGTGKNCDRFLHYISIARSRGASVDADGLVQEIECTWASGDHDKARTLLRSFRVLNPDHPRAEKLRIRLRSTK